MIIEKLINYLIIIPIKFIVWAIIKWLEKIIIKITYSIWFIIILSLVIKFIH